MLPYTIRILNISDTSLMSMTVIKCHSFFMLSWYCLQCRHCKNRIALRHLDSFFGIDMSQTFLQKHKYISSCVFMFDRHLCLQPYYGLMSVPVPDTLARHIQITISEILKSLDIALHFALSESLHMNSSSENLFTNILLQFSVYDLM